MTGKPIFFDPTGKRSRALARLAWAAGTLSLAILTAFFATLLTVHRPAVEQGPITHVSIRCAWAPTCSAAHGLPVAAADPEALRNATSLAADLRERERDLHHHPQAQVVERRSFPSSLVRPKGRPLSIGFYVNWDDNSYPALKRALPRLDWVIPTWLTLDGPDMALTAVVEPRVLDYIQTTKPDTAILPMIQNASNGQWNGAGLAKMLADPAARAERIQEIVTYLGKYKFQGVTVDFEDVPESSQKNVERFLTELREAFVVHDYAILVAVPFNDDSWPYEAYANIADFLVLMAYDEHDDAGDPGSIAGESWFEDKLDERMKSLDPDHTIIAIGGYAYDWVKGEGASSLTFEEAVLSARDSEADIVFDPETSNPHFSFIEDDGKRHDVWFLDGATAFNEIHAADDYRPAGYALWRLGSEDPSVWSTFGKNYGAPAPNALRRIASAQDIDFEGEGEILHVAEEPVKGSRSFDVDHHTGEIVDEKYTAVPTPFVIERTGATKGKLALTFDDGPDPDFTPQVLDILKEKGVHASFFIIGQNAAAYPGLVQRLVAEGHDVGNHTFTHPNLGELPGALVTLEINATERLFEALTGRSMRLFRAPYLGDAEPTTADEIVPMEIAQDMGYLSVGLHVDPNDWQGPTADQIIQRVLAQVSDPNPDIRGHVILLHDSGGDRSATVEALPRLIDALRAKGYEFVPVSQLAGMTHDQAMPPVPPQALGRMVGLPVFLTYGWLGHAITTLFFAAIWLGVLRLLFLCVVALRNWQVESRRVPPELPAEPPLQSVLIPAHNEGKVIAETIRHILASDYSNLEVIVVDDGSKDNTAEVVRTVFANDARVRLITMPNGGKAAALNRGLAEARGEVVVALDADTYFPRDSIRKLVGWFADPDVGAVAGNAKVGNRVNIITRWQALEYITSQSLERRMLASLGCITVVPGAIGAWRREVLQELGGFPSDTLAEDQDLTISVLKGGCKVLYDSTAVAWTEAPDTVSDLIKQRFRWAFGTLQCLWKHRMATLKPRYGSLGLVAIPQTWVFQFMLSFLAPFVDFVLLWRLVFSAIDVYEHQSQFDSQTLQKVLFYYCAFILVDLCSAALALAMERTEDKKLLPWLVLQRFGYRQLMYYIVIKAGFVALFGPLVGWNKLERKSTVNAVA
jgi:cellulose synthase/poly-beta-1,6-N-acetylglucosamine synthase-like glycosyltransferase/peptidoglycan/xylan/chitin deacetylase (PgdA/CDA1 family)/spore germination protein YaaH